MREAGEEKEEEEEEREGGEKEGGSVGQRLPREKSDSFDFDCFCEQKRRLQRWRKRSV